MIHPKVFFLLLGIFLCIAILSRIPITEAQADEYEYEDEDDSAQTITNPIQPNTNRAATEQASTDEYEYEYEEEEVVVNNREFENVPFSVIQAQRMNQQGGDASGMNGFVRHGGGLMKIGRPLVDEYYINETVEKYDCVRFVDSLVQIVEFQEEDDMTMNVTAQIQEIKQKMDKVMQMANRMGGDAPTNDATTNSADPTTRTLPPKNETATANATDANAEKTSGKRLSFREKQALRLQQRKEREHAREALRPKFRLGADCETLICGSCKAIVDEFGQMVFNAIKDPKVKYIDQLTENFCGSKVITVKYMDIVGDVCNAFQQETLGYKEAMVSAFEGLQKWEDSNKLPALATLKKNICTTIGACELEQFEFQKEALHYTQEQWDDKCFTCQAFAKDLEERVHLTRHLTERNIVPLVAETCDRLDLEPHYRSVCQEMVEGKLLDDVSWLAKMHGESVARKAKAELKFPDKLCQEIDWCRPWVDPEKLKEQEAEATMEQVFF